MPGFTRRSVRLRALAAMDAVGELHDQIRHFANGWHRLDRTIAGLKRLRAAYANLIIGLKTTILPESVGQLDDIAGYASAHGLFTIISPCIITAGRYLNRDRAAALAFTPRQIQEMTAFFQVL